MSELQTETAGSGGNPNAGANADAATTAKRRAPAKAEEAFDEITYIPQNGDPVRTTWNGIHFPAHIPVKVPRTVTIAVPMPIQTKGADGELINGIVQPDGSIQTRHVERKVPLVELAKGNPLFSVNGAAPAEAKKGQARVPDTPDQYRGYAIRWIAASTNAKDMDARWNAEVDLREKCGCNDEDIGYLRPFFEARHDQLLAA